jgi:tight adherence protein C
VGAVKAAFCAVAAVTVMLLVMTRGRYTDLIRPLDRRSYPLGGLLAIGFYILEAARYRYTSAYDRSLLAKCIEVHGPGSARYYQKTHWANKITLLILGVHIVLFLGMFTVLDFGYLVLSISLLCGITLLADRELNANIRKRRAAIRMGFPDFLNKLVLLINAGMTVSRAIEKTVADYTGESSLYEELGTVISDIKAGKSEYRAYEDFAKRCGMPEITRVISVLLQNMRKGNSELVSILRVLSNECWDMRKNMARKLGEEASTRMLLPLMLMFLAILMIVATPAVLALRGI